MEDWEISQTNSLVGSSTPSLSHPCNLHSCSLIFYPARSSLVTFPLNNTASGLICRVRITWFCSLVRRHHRCAGMLITTYTAFGIQVWILLEKGDTRSGPGHRAATRGHAGLSFALPGASYSRKAGRSSVELCKTPFLLTSIHSARTGFDFHRSG